VGSSEVSVSGKAAAFGNRMVGAVADQVLAQFAANFAEKVKTLQAQATPTPPSASTPAAPESDPASPAAPAMAAEPEAARPLSALSLLWGWLRSLFAGRTQR
jgi:hypothetical protein